MLDRWERKLYAGHWEVAAAYLLREQMPIVLLPPIDPLDEAPTAGQITAEQATAELLAWLDRYTEREDS